MTVVPGFDLSEIRMDTTGSVVVTSGTMNHGQSHETTFAQIVADRLGLDVSRVKLRQGDTERIAYGWGTFASRSVTIGGSAVRAGLGAARRSCSPDRRAPAGDSTPDNVALDGDGGVVQLDDPARRLPFEDIADVAYLRSHLLPKDVEPALTATASFDVPGDGTFSNASHAVVVEADPGTGEMRILRYVCVEDCGVVINPKVVDGQCRGGIAQGIAGALFEEVTYDDHGEPSAASFIDYLVPTATEIPDVSIQHLETPCAFTANGAKGAGEGGTIGAPAAVLNAVNDALRHTGVELDTTPIHPRDRAGRTGGRAVRDPHLLALTVNDEEHEVVVEPRRTLADVLRHDLLLTGTHVGCEHGMCGACTVLLDDAPVRACLVFAVQAEGVRMRTVESLADHGELSDLQQAFSDHHGLQCGFCTPGFLMLAEGVLAEQPDASTRGDPRGARRRTCAAAPATRPSSMRCTRRRARAGRAAS